MSDRIITIHENKAYKQLGDMFGIFFEDINHAADGGLYAEMVQNRSFEYCELDNKDYNGLTAWKMNEAAEAKLCDENPVNDVSNRYLELSAAPGACLENVGFADGMFFEKGKTYRFSMYSRNNDDFGKPVLVWLGEKGEPPVPDKVNEKDADGAGMAMLPAGGDDGFVKLTLLLDSVLTTKTGALWISFPDGANVDIDMVSLFPSDTFKERENGVRKDIAEALAEMTPRFMRFPGGCLTHCGDLYANSRCSMYRWEKTIAPIDRRPTWRNTWGYNQSLGMGFYEYFLLCEDIGCEPVPVIPGAFNPHTGEGAPMHEIQEWVDEALHLIEFANGGTSTTWGRKRADMGHPRPFDLKYIGIGNEEIGEGFFERYPYFHKAIKSQYPDVKIINTAGPFPTGEGYEVGWASARRFGSDLVDEHYYTSPEWMLANLHRYDEFDEGGPGVFVGEYASWSNTLYSALAEAVYMQSLEKAKAVSMACYAPLLCNKDYVNWKPDLIWFDNSSVLKTPNYYVQKLFMNYQGSEELEFTTEGFNEGTPMNEETIIAGDIAICANDISGLIWGVLIRDEVTGEEMRALDYRFETKASESVLGFMGSEKYTLEFYFRRNSGHKGLDVEFGRKDGTKLVWNFGGWANQDCNIQSFVNGRGSVISHRIFSVEDRDYKLRLEVEGRHIRTYIDDVLWNDCEDRQPVIEELYISASRDRRQNKSYVKVVNLTEVPKDVTINLEGYEISASERIIRGNLFVMSGENLEDENTFEEPEKIAPVKSAIIIEDSCLKHTFPPHSLSVFELFCY